MAIVQNPILHRSKRIVTFMVLLIALVCTDAYSRNFSSSKIKKIVIDAGHGGKVPGAVGRIYLEKDIVLPVALRLGRLIEERLPGIEVIFTRNKDFNVDLAERANIANSNKADLFISIHANAGKEGDHETTGYETYVMGGKTEENMDIVMRENSVIQYEENYEEKYSDFNSLSTESDIIFSLMQMTFLEKSIKFAEFVQQEFKGGPIEIDRGIKQAPFIVLWRTAAPAVLIEIGFISNIVEEQLLGDIANQQKIAESIFRAVVRYYNYINGVEDAAQNTNDSLMMMNKTGENAVDSVNHQTTNTNATYREPAKTYKWITE